MENKPIKVLLVEDNEDDAALIREILSENKDFIFRIEWVRRLSEGIDRIRKKKFAVVLLDLTLPDSKGLDTVTGLKKNAANIPVIVLTGLDDGEIGIKSIRKGVQDYIVKKYINSYSLPCAIRYAIERQKLIANIKTLRGLLPICSRCKKIRDDRGYWQRVEEYIQQHSQADFSHSLCPDCVQVLYPGFKSGITAG